MNANFSKYPAEDRVKEMTKQEEILLKRKREIERRLGFQDVNVASGGGGVAEGRPPKGPPGPPMAPMPKYAKTHTNSRLPSSSVTVSSKTVNHSNHRPSHTSGPLSRMNKFSNDGSFFEQFKRLAEKEKVEVKEETHFTGEPLKIEPKPAKPSQAPLPKPKHPAFFDDGQDSSDFGDLGLNVKTENEEKVDLMYPAAAPNSDGTTDVNHPDWFKEALRKVQEKARLVNSDSSG